MPTRSPGKRLRTLTSFGISKALLGRPQLCLNRSAKGFIDKLHVLNRCMLLFQPKSSNRLSRRQIASASGPLAVILAEKAWAAAFGQKRALALHCKQGPVVDN